MIEKVKITDKIAFSIANIYHKIAEMQEHAAKENEIRVKAVELLGKENSFDHSAYNAEKIYLYLRDNIKFVDDIDEIETLQDPILTIKNKFGDCDDMVLLGGALYRSIGYHIALILVKINGNIDYNHIYLGVYTTDEGWRTVDAANKNGVFNWEIDYDNYTKRKIVFIGSDNYIDNEMMNQLIDPKTVVEFYNPGQNRTFWLFAGLAAIGTFIITIFKK